MRIGKRLERNHVAYNIAGALSLVSGQLQVRTHLGHTPAGLASVELNWVSAGRALRRACLETKGQPGPEASWSPRTCLPKVLYAVFDYSWQTTLLAIVSHKLLQRHAEKVCSRGCRQADLSLMLEVLSAILLSGWAAYGMEDAH